MLLSNGHHVNQLPFLSTLLSTLLPLPSKNRVESLKAISVSFPDSGGDTSFRGA